MADRYWVGGTGTWNTSSTTNWSASSGGGSGASVPTAADNVIFDQAATYTVTLTGVLACLSITVSAGTVTFSSTGTLAVSGSMSLVAATVWSATGTITFNSTSTGNTVTTNGVTMSNSMTFNGVGGSWQLQSALTLGSTRLTTLTNGTLDLNNYTLTTGIYAGTGSGVRSLLSYGVPIVLTGSSTAGNTLNIIVVGTSTNFTVDTRPTFNLTSSPVATAGTRNMSWGGGTNFAALANINVTNGSDTVTSSGTSSFNNITFSGTFTGTWGNFTRFIYGSLTFKTGMTVASGTSLNTFNGVGSQTITTVGFTLDFPITFNGVGGTWAMQDALTMGSTQALTMTNGTLQLKSGTTNTVGSFATSGTNQKYLQSTTPGAQATLSAASGTNTVSYLTIQDSNATGGATWSALSSSIDAGNNTGWIFSPSDVGFGTGNGGTCFGFGFRI